MPAPLASITSPSAANAAISARRDRAAQLAFNTRVVRSEIRGTQAGRMHPRPLRKPHARAAHGATRQRGGRAGVDEARVVRRRAEPLEDRREARLLRCVACEPQHAALAPRERGQGAEAADGVDERGTRQPRVGCVGQVQHRLHDAGGIARGALRDVRGAIDDAHRPAARREALGDRGAGETGADHDRPARTRRIGGCARHASRRASPACVQSRAAASPRSRPCRDPRAPRPRPTRSRPSRPAGRADRSRGAPRATTWPDSSPARNHRGRWRPPAHAAAAAASPRHRRRG